MAVTVPSLTNSLYLTDTQSIIINVLQRYTRTPQDTIPIFSDLIISLKWTAARFKGEPDNLVAAMTAELQNCYDRIFGNNFLSAVVTWPGVADDNGNYAVTLAVTYTEVSGKPVQTGTTISLTPEGQLIIPEDTIQFGVTQIPS